MSLGIRIIRFAKRRMYYYWQYFISPIIDENRLWQEAAKTRIQKLKDGYSKISFTFGIITGGNQERNINKIIDSIEKQKIEKYEIIIVGECNLRRKNTMIISFDETIKPMWITKKKNMITQLAKYENIVYLHDYICLYGPWYWGYVKFGNDFKVCMNKIINEDSTRYRDWTLWCHDAETDNCLLPYDVTTLSRFMYISGAYWVAKKCIMEKYPLDERLSWGQAEDVAWSKKYRITNDFSINPYSTVKLLKYKPPIYGPALEATIKKLENL